MSFPVQAPGSEVRGIVDLTTGVKITAVYKIQQVTREGHIICTVDRYDIPAGVCKLCWCEAMTCDCDGGPKL